jgi:hypothetical protein
MHVHLRVSKPLAGVHVHSMVSTALSSGLSGVTLRPMRASKSIPLGLGGDAIMVVILRFIDGLNRLTL